MPNRLSINEMWFLSETNAFLDISLLERSAVEGDSPVRDQGSTCTVPAE